jgi:hypothetical protein
MSDTTRLAFIKRSAATAASMTVVGAIVAEDADAKVARQSGAVVAYIKKPASGEIVVMKGKKQVVVHDKKLAARIAHAGH